MMILNQTQIAFTEWSNTQPADGGDCPCINGSANHYISTQVIKKSPTGQQYFVTVSTPNLDDKVCDRERAWRKYVALRDDKGLS